MDAVNPVLARKLGLKQTTPDLSDAGGVDDGGRDGGASGATAPIRQMRRAAGRAFDVALGLSVSVVSMDHDRCDAEQLIEDGPVDWLVLGLRDGDHAGLTGLVLMDPQMRSAVNEMLTTGHLLAANDAQRAVTRTDAVMAIPFADQFLKELANVSFGGARFDPASYDIGPMDDLRTAGLVLTQGGYHSWRVTFELGGGARQGELLFALRPLEEDPVINLAEPAWSDALRAAVLDAPLDLDAVLARVVLPMTKVEGFEVGQVITLAGVTVGSVMLSGPDGKSAAQARLGQIAGKRAVRIEQEVVELADVPVALSATETQTVTHDELAASEIVDGNDLIDG